MQTVQALQASRHEVYFATTYWYHPNRFLEKFTKRFFPKLHTIFLKKQAETISIDSVLTKFSSLFYQWWHRLKFSTVETRSFMDDLIHDKWVSAWVTLNRPEIVIGYEKSCLQTFEAVKQYGGKCYLDLAQVHPFFIKQLRNEYEFFKEITGSDKLFNIITNKKIAEYELADQIFSLSLFAKQTLIEQGIPDSKIVVNQLGYNPSIFYPKQKKPYNHPIKFIYAGIITKRKGIHLLLEVISNFLSTDVELLLVGPKGDASDTLNKYKTYTNITYYEAMPQNQLADLFRNADVFLFPSFLDSWAAVVPEAMACGLPVIITRCTGASEMVTPDAGIIIDSCNVEQLENAIRFFVNNRDLINVMSEAAIMQSKQFTWANYQNRLLQQINSIN